MKNRASTHVKPIPKAPTGIGGLDDILEGGLPKGRTTLVGGGPGSGKTILGLEFVYRGALAGEPGVFISFEESAAAVRQNASALGWDLTALEKAGKLALLNPRLPTEVTVSGDFNLKGLLAILDGQVRALRAKRIVIDAVDALTRIYDDPKRERNELYALHHWLDDQQLTAILTAKIGEDAGPSGRHGYLDFMVDCVLRLDQRVAGQVTTRRLRVIKYRGSGFGRNEYPYLIGPGGTTYVPLSMLELMHQPLGGRVSAGQPRLDELLGGGFLRGACILLSGTSGTGKTTLAVSFARAACARGEKVLYLGFEESEAALVSCMLSPGLDLRPALRAKKLRIQAVMPEAVGAEEHLIRAYQIIAEFGPDHMILDAISACRRMGSDQAAFDFLMRLVNTCKQRGITCLLLNQTPGLQETDEITGIGFSSLVDAVLLLRFEEQNRTVHRDLLVMKLRGSKHSHQHHRYRITDHGVEILANGTPGAPEGSPA